MTQESRTECDEMSTLKYQTSSYNVLYFCILHVYFDSLNYQSMIVVQSIKKPQTAHLKSCNHRTSQTWWLINYKNCHSIHKKVGETWVVLTFDQLATLFVVCCLDWDSCDNIRKCVVLSWIYSYLVFVTQICSFKTPYIPCYL